MTTSFDLPGFHLNLEGVLGFPHSKVPFEKAHESLKAKFESKAIGFYDWPVEIPNTLLRQIETAAQVLRKDYEAALLIGIGGSYLGGASVLDALRAPQDRFQLLWLSNVDKTSLEQARISLKGKKTALLVISKSGNTVETLSALYATHSLFDPKAVFAITDPEKGELRKLSQKFDWKTFPVPPNIGGRFSVLTAVGLFPAELGGVSSSGLLQGARKMREYLEKTKPSENPAYLYAAATHYWTIESKKNIHILMPYESSLQKLGDWFVQLWAESIGKKRKSDGTPVGFTPIRCLGTTDQHSQLQLFKEGPADKVVGFLDVVDEASPLLPKTPYLTPDFEFLTQHSISKINSQALLAVQTSLSRSGTPTYTARLDSLSGKSGAETLGAFLFFQETACAFAGELFGVNAFDQPGVEETKTLLRSAL